MPPKRSAIRARPAKAEPRETPPLRASSLAATFACIGVLVAVVLAVHWPVLHAKAAAFDDQMYVDDNPLVRNPSWNSAGRFLGEVLRPSTVGGYYQPLAMISLMMDVAAGGSPENPVPFHRTSLLLHAANTALVFVILFGLFGRLLPAALVALLFGLHPMTVEPIAWVAERKTTLAAFFALACIALYVRYARRPSVGKLGVCVVLYALALMAKPTATPVPAVLLVLDVWPLRRLKVRAVVEKLPFFTVGIVSAAITYYSQAKTSITADLGQQSPSRIVLTVVHNVIFYLAKWIRPVHLSPHYAYPDPFTASQPWVLAGLIGTPILVAALALLWKRMRGPLAGWMIFMLAIFPTLGVVGFTNVIASDKYAYLPMIGFLLPVAALLSHLANRAGPSGNAVRSMALPGLALALVIAGMAVQTRRQIAVWMTSETLGEHMVAIAPQAAEPRIQYGTALANAGKIDAGIEQFKQALVCRDFDPAAKYNLAVLYDRQKRTDDAIAMYELALRDAQRLTFCPDTPKILNNLGALLMRKNRMAEAKACFEQVLAMRPDFAAARANLALLGNPRSTGADAAELDRAVAANPDDVDARLRLADALLRQNAAEAAETHVQRALKIKPDSPNAHLMLGRIRRKQGKPEEALACYRDAMRLSPDAVDAHVAAAVLLGEMSRFEAALAEYAEVVRRQPNHVDARSDMGTMCARLGRFTEAAEHHREALRLDPGNPNRRFNLAYALVESGQTDEAVKEFGALLTANPSNSLARLGLAGVLVRTQRYVEAERELHTVVQAQPNDFRGHLGLAALYEEVGRIDEAVSQYKEALRLKPDLPPAAEGIKRLEARRSL